jgi:hypothetical protein
MTLSDTSELQSLESGLTKYVYQQLFDIAVNLSHNDFDLDERHREIAQSMLYDISDNSEEKNYTTKLLDILGVFRHLGLLERKDS